jgi:RimJ/RimL family protein N-acetyltransferase
MEHKKLSLREATKQDLTLLFRWANDSAVRLSSLSPEPIDWEDHIAWLTKKLLDPSCHIFIASNTAGDPVGQIRFDLQDNGSAAIDVHIAQESRGQGYGTSLIVEGTDRLFCTTDIRIVHAYQRPDNTASVRVFEKAGFSSEGEIELKGHTVHHSVLHRS